MRYIILTVIVASVFVFGFKAGDTPTAQSAAIQQQPQSETNIDFEWAFGALIGADKKLVSVTKDTILKSGEEFKMYVKLHKECFVYVVYYGSKGELALMFPSSIQQFQKDYLVDKNYYIPVGRKWEQLDQNTGPEKFFLVASSERLLDLEAKIGTYLSAEDSKKKTLAEEVVSEVRNVRKRYSTFATIAEKPITIGGNIRAIAEQKEEVRRPDVSTIATKITANNFYSKTITIDHQ
jgi:hypothetical protein